MSYAKWAYEEKEQRLIKLEETADCIREDMDDLWREMTDEERELTNKLPKELSERWNKYKVKADAAEARDARWKAAVKAFADRFNEDNSELRDGLDPECLTPRESDDFRHSERGIWNMAITAMQQGNLEALETILGIEVG